MSGGFLVFSSPLLEICHPPVDFYTRFSSWTSTDSLYSANLKDETVMKEYERGYKVALDFLDKYFV